MPDFVIIDPARSRAYVRAQGHIYNNYVKMCAIHRPAHSAPNILTHARNSKAIFKYFIMPPYLTWVLNPKAYDLI